MSKDIPNDAESLRADISSAWDKPSTDVAPADVAPAPDKPLDTPADVKPAASQDDKPEAKPLDKPADPNAPAAVKPADPKPAEAIKAPATFPGGDAAYAALPPETRDWLKKRDAGVARTLQGSAEAAKFGGAMWSAVQPYEAMLRQQGAHPVQVVAEAMNMHYVMSTASQTDKVAAIQRMAQKYGVELPMGDQGQAQAPQPDPRIERLETALRYLASNAKQREEQQVQGQLSAAMQSVETFANDPQYEHIKHPGVIEAMARLLETGFAQDLPHAYQTAIWTRSDLRAVLSEKDAARRASEARAAADAATNRGGAPVAAVTKPNDDSLRGEIERAVDAAQRRAA